MNKDHTEATVYEMPTCDLCARFKDKTPEIAAYDGKTRMGPWAYMCEGCFATLGLGLGLGVGQRLVVREPSDG